MEAQHLITQQELHDPTDRRCKYHHPGFVSHPTSVCLWCAEFGAQRPW